MTKSAVVALSAAMLFIYAVVIVFGIRQTDLRTLFANTRSEETGRWRAESEGDIPTGPQGDDIRRGMQIFHDTPYFAPQFTGDKLSCNDCHTEGGTAPYSAPLVGIVPSFPMYSRRAGHRITLEDRIQECFTRSENGTPLPYDGPEMKALMAYIRWLSAPHPIERPFTGRGLISLPVRTPNPVHGSVVYAEQCAGCHGVNGEGSRPLFPPLWGPESFNDGAGIDGIPKLAAFVQYNMPQNRKGSLSAQEAWDVSAFIHQQPRPKFNPAYSKY